jgi:hypothetical protein
MYSVKEISEIVWVMPILCFSMAFATDWCWTKYIKRASDGNAIPAAWWSLLIYGFSSMNVLAYTKNPWLIVPMMVGYFFGTYYAVKHDHKGAENGKATGG